MGPWTQIETAVMKKIGDMDPNPGRRASGKIFLRSQTCAPEALGTCFRRWHAAGKGVG